MIVIAALLFGIFTADSARAQVSHRDWGFTALAGPTLRTGDRPTALGPHIGFGANYGFHPMWNFSSELTVALPVSFVDEERAPDGFSGPYLSAGAFVGISTVFDVLKIVPWLRIAGGTLLEQRVAWDEQKRVGLNPALMLSLGLDVRKVRDHAWGAQADLIAAARPDWRWAHYVRLSLRYTWMRSRSGI